VAGSAPTGMAIGRCSRSVAGGRVGSGRWKAPTASAGTSRSGWSLTGSRTRPRRCTPVPVRNAGQGAAGDRAAARCRRLDPPPARGRAARRHRHPRPQTQGQRAAADRGGRRDRLRVARPLRHRPGRRRPDPRRRRRRRPVPDQGALRLVDRHGPRSTRPPASRSATGSPAPGTGGSTGCCTSWPSSKYATTPPGRGYYRRKLAAGKTPMEALRCLKRRLSDVIYRQLTADAKHTRTGPGGHWGATLKSSAASPTPAADSSDKSLPGPADQQPTPVR
jgi:hypothetical protein